jgi:hypothetical protein
MSSYGILLRRLTVAVIGALTWGCVMMAPPSIGAESTVTTTNEDPPPNTQFFVDFSGIIVHVLYPPDTQTFRRAVIIEADLFKPHSPTLYVPLPQDAKAQASLKASLRAATGKTPYCGKSQCRVRIGGIAMRIRGDDPDKPSLTPADSTSSFKCLLPHLRSDPALNMGPIRGEHVKQGTPTQAMLPSGAALGYFEIENGLLDASPFEQAGFFYPAGQACPAAPSDPTLCRQFADIVTWSGRTEGPATLEISSDDTAWKWKRIPIGNEGPLMISVENLANEHAHTSEHFALNEKLFVNRKLPQICFCKNPPDPCAGGGINAINAVPGCSNSAWP